MSDKNILIVEDESIIAMEMEMTLLDMGYKVCDIVNKGENVLPTVKKKKPNLILMDINLKGRMNGIDAAKSLYENHYDIPIVYCSAEINKERLDKIKVPNTYGFMIKPLKEDNLYTTIELCYEKHKLETELKNKNEELEKTNEELKMSYEELERANEELERSFEELERTNVELEEVNEELDEVNEELEEANEELKISENKLSIIFNNNIDPQLLWEISSSNEIILISVNNAYLNVVNTYGFNLKKEDFIGKKINEVAKLSGISPEVLDFTLKQYHKALTTKEIVKYNIDVKLKEKSYYSEYTLTPILNNEGECKYILFNSYNITDIVEAQNKLKESEARLRTIVKNMPVMLDAFDENNNIIMWNKQCEIVTGYSEEEIVNSDNPLKLLYPDEDYRKELINFWANREDNFYDAQSTIMAKNGEKKIISWYNVSKTNPIKGWNDWAIGIDITKQKELEQALKERERQYREIFEGSRDGYVIVDINSHITKANKSFCNMLGYSIEELKNIENFYEITPEKWHEWEREEIWNNRLLKKGYSEVYRKEYIRKDGTVFPVELQSYTVRDNENNILYLWGVARDVTEKVRAENEIKESEEKFRNFFENASDPIFVAEAETGILIDANKKAEGLIGKTKQEILGLHQSELHPPYQCQTTKKSFKEDGNQEGNTVYKEFKVLHKDGHTIPVEISPSVIKIKGKKAIYGIFRDISYRRTMEKKLREQNQKLENIIEGTQLGTWEWNIQTGETIFNERWAEIIGYTLDELKPTTIETWGKFAHPDDLVKSNNLLQKHFNNELDFYEFESRIKHKSGEWVWVLDRGKVIEWDEDGKPLLMFGTHSDITNRKKTEYKLKDFTKKLEESNKELKSFAYRVAHDLKSPLNNLISGLRLMKRGKVVEHKEKTFIIDEMTEKTYKLIEQIESILNFSKITISSSFKALRLKKLVEGVIKTLNNLIRDKSATIITNNIDIKVCADEGLFVSLFQNLIYNALKYNKNKPEIIISVVSKNNNEWLFSIKDNGIGISEKDKDKIFELMYRVENIKKEYEGTGIGLASCKKIVELHNGEIWVESELDKGSTFYFTVPKKIV